ncbi:MAG: dihydrofolate reductase [Bowdeniella nasicola]|nr:dihydrofolate reductase [Bowdeniella nasicola]
MIGAIWATANGVLGDAGTMPWHLPEDLAHFQNTTMGAAVLMGYTTWCSLPAANRPLAGRNNYVASRRHDISDATVVRDLEAFLTDSRWQREMLWVMGGAEIYAHTRHFWQCAAITEIDLDVAGDTLAPTVPPGRFSCEPWQVSKRGLRYRFCSWQADT